MKEKGIRVVIAIAITAVSISAMTAQESNAKSPLLRYAPFVIERVTRSQSDSMVGYFLTYCPKGVWKSFESDSDLGPFLKYKSNEKNLDAVIAMPSKAGSGATYCVYLKGGKPVGFVKVKPGTSISVESVSKGYEAYGEVRDPSAITEYVFEEGTVYSDDNKPIPTLKVLKAREQ